MKISNKLGSIGFHIKKKKCKKNIFYGEKIEKSYYPVFFQYKRVGRIGLVSKSLKQYLMY